MRLRIKTKGSPELVDISAQVQKSVANSGVLDGLVLVNVIGSTAAVSTLEFEPGLIKDQRALTEKLVPKQADYAHNAAGGDGNGYSHLRATLYKSSLVLPVEDGSVVLGTWQQIVLMEFDNRPREREIVIKIIAEK